MSNGKPVPTKAEMEILQILWRLGPATVRQVHEEIPRAISYTTVLKLLQIMAEKGIVTRETGERAHVYKAEASRQRTTRAFMRDIVERVFGGSASQLVMQALNSRKTSPEELKEIRKLIDDLDKQ